MRPFLTVAVVLAGLALSASAQAPYLVKDLGNAGSGIGPQSSQPKAFLSSGSMLFFTATTEPNGSEPWVRDANGARLLRDINGGPAGSGITNFLELTPGVVVFAADDGESGTQLWRSDGTDAGTILLKTVNGTAFTFFLSMRHGGQVFFYVDDGVHGTEPWVTDGTTGGTKLLVDSYPGPVGNSLGRFFLFGGIVRFFAGGGIWTTDGTPDGTSLLVPLEFFGRQSAVQGGTIYFAGYDAVNGYALWKSDGTPAGTAMIKDIRGGSPFNPFSSAIAATSTGAVFIADDGAGRRLWTTDGTAENTVPLAAFPTNGVAANAAFFNPTPQGVFFWAGSNIWRTDGTEAGTYIAATFGQHYGPAFDFTSAFSKIYFSIWYGAQLRLMHFDGSAGATPVDALPGMTVSDVAFTGGKFWFAGNNATNGSELWVSDDGTAAGTYLVANLAPDPARSSTPVSLTAAGRFLYFHPQEPQELWRSDGTSGGTIEVTDIANGLFPSPAFGSLTPYRGDVYFRRGFSEWFRVDGVNGGATKISDGALDAMTADENYIYQWNYSSGHLRRSDGTAAGTIALHDPSEPDHLDGSYDNLEVLTYGGFAWVRCRHGIVRTEGTVETTRRVVSIPENASLTGAFVAAGGLLYSVISTGAHGNELWRSDGTGGGSFMVKDASPGAGSSNPTYLTAAGRLLFFIATDPEHGTELWRSDGTEAGTFMVKDILPGTASSTTSAPEALGDVVYFAANDGTSGVELWKSDGTEAGTVPVRDIAPGSFSSKPAGLAAADGKIWFSANDGLHGIELWSSDGTEFGTVLVGDIIPGSSSSSPQWLTPAESTLFFTATTDAEGRELWAMPLTTGYLSITGTRIAEGNSGTRALRFTVTRHGASAGAASVVYSTAPGTATAGTDYTTASGTIHFAAGETVKTVDVTVHGDTETEPSETLYLQLSSPAGVALQDATTAGVIDDDDPLADLAAGIVQNGDKLYDETSRILTVTNNGPSSAYGITVTFTESPYDFSIYSTPDVDCTNTLPMQCTFPFLQAGDTRTLTINRHTIEGLVDPALPPGRTVTVHVASTITDPDPSNNTTSRMTTGNGMLLLPASLVAGTSATATFDLGQNATSATDVTLTSSAVNVAVTPVTARIEAGQRIATFTLNTSAGADKTLLTATIAAVTKAALVVPVVASGQQPLLDVAIAANNDSTLEYGELFIIPVRVAARYPDGTVPSGLLALLDQNGNTLAELALDTTGAATFTRPQPAPGQHHYRLRYSGDARFNPLTAAMPAITVGKADPAVVLHMVELSCSSTVEVRVVVTGPEGAPAPTGTIRLSRGSTALADYTLAPNGEPGQSVVTANLQIVDGFHHINALYFGDAYFSVTERGKDLRVGCAPMNLVATATSPTTVALSWTPAPTSTHTYDVFRGESVEGPFQFVARATSSLSVVDTTAQAGRVYLYYLRTYGSFSAPSYNSNLDVASTLAWTDNPLAPGMPVKSVHFTELRSMAAQLRALAALPAITFAGSVAPGSPIEARHVTDIRGSIDASRARIGLPAIGWSQPGAVSGATIRAATIQELRGAVN